METHSTNIKRGWLAKRGQRFKTWKKRWCVLNAEAGVILYYSDQSENKLKGQVGLRDAVITIIETAPPGSRSPNANTWKNKLARKNQPKERAESRSARTMSNLENILHSKEHAQLSRSANSVHDPSWTEPIVLAVLQLSAIGGRVFTAYGIDAETTVEWALAIEVAIRSANERVRSRTISGETSSGTSGDKPLGENSIGSDSEMSGTDEAIVKSQDEDENIDVQSTNDSSLMISCLAAYNYREGARSRTLYVFCLQWRAVTWKILKRFSDIYKLDQKLRKEVRSYRDGNIIAPKKTIVRHLGDTFLHRRQVELASYLQALLDDPQIIHYPILQSFFCFPRRIVAVFETNELQRSKSRKEISNRYEDDIPDVTKPIDIPYVVKAAHEAGCVAFEGYMYLKNSVDSFYNPHKWRKRYFVLQGVYLVHYENRRARFADAKSFESEPIDLSGRVILPAVNEHAIRRVATGMSISSLTSFSMSSIPPADFTQPCSPSFASNLSNSPRTFGMSSQDEEESTELYENVKTSDYWMLDPDEDDDEETMPSGESNVGESSRQDRNMTVYKIQIINPRVSERIIKLAVKSRQEQQAWSSLLHGAATESLERRLTQQSMEYQPVSFEITQIENEAGKPRIGRLRSLPGLPLDGLGIIRDAERSNNRALSTVYDSEEEKNDLKSTLPPDLGKECKAETKEEKEVDAQRNRGRSLWPERESHEANLPGVVHSADERQNKKPFEVLQTEWLAHLLAKASRDALISASRTLTRMNSEKVDSKENLEQEVCATLSLMGENLHSADIAELARLILVEKQQREAVKALACRLSAIKSQQATEVKSTNSQTGKSVSAVSWRFLLCKNDIGGSGISELAELMCQTEKNVPKGAVRKHISQSPELLVRELWLGEADHGGNHIGIEGCIALSAALKGNRYLRALGLAHNQILDEGVIAIANQLVENRTLRVLDLSHNRIHKDGMESILRLCIPLSTIPNQTQPTCALVVLNMSHNPILRSKNRFPGVADLAQQVQSQQRAAGKRTQQSDLCGKTLMDSPPRCEIPQPRKGRKVQAHKCTKPKHNEEPGIFSNLLNFGDANCADVKEKKRNLGIFQLKKKAEALEEKEEDDTFVMVNPMMQRASHTRSKTGVELSSSSLVSGGSMKRTRAISEEDHSTQPQTNCSADIRSQAISTIGRAIAMNNTFLFLAFDGCGLGNDGLEKISLGLRQNQTLIHLSLNHNQIKDNGIKSLISAFGGYVDPCEESSVDSVSRLYASRINTTLRQLHLRFNPGISPNLLSTLQLTFLNTRDYSNLSHLDQSYVSTLEFGTEDDPISWYFDRRVCLWTD